MVLFSVTVGAFRYSGSILRHGGGISVQWFYSPSRWGRLGTVFLSVEYFGAAVLFSATVGHFSKMVLLSVFLGAFGTAVLLSTGHFVTVVFTRGVFPYSGSGVCCGWNSQSEPTLVEQDRSKVVLTYLRKVDHQRIGFNPLASTGTRHLLGLGSSKYNHDTCSSLGPCFVRSAPSVSCVIES